jgi:hypothetical protein
VLSAQGFVLNKMQAVAFAERWESTPSFRAADVGRSEGVQARTKGDNGGRKEGRHAMVLGQLCKAGQPENPCGG